MTMSSPPVAAETHSTVAGASVTHNATLHLELDAVLDR